MTDHELPANLTEEEVERARRWAEGIEANPKSWSLLTRTAARVVLDTVPAPTPPTLADMTPEERDACTGMQADLVQGDRVVILDGTPDSDGLVQVLEKSLDVYRPAPDDVTPRPDLPRLEWPGTDQDGEEVTKVDYVSVAGGRTAYGPWTVARLRKKADPAPALPDGWRLADHWEDGRVIVTKPTPDPNGHVYFVYPDDEFLSGNDWNFCRPDELTFLDSHTTKEADQ